MKKIILLFILSATALSAEPTEPTEVVIAAPDLEMQLKIFLAGFFTMGPFVWWKWTRGAVKEASET